jgi:hypothetical protein
MREEADATVDWPRRIGHSVAAHFPAPGVVAAILAVLALSSGVRYLSGPVQWTTDGLFYESQLLELRGTPHDEALHRVFTSRLAHRRQEKEAGWPRALRKATNPEWVRYSARFYRRRWVVPLLGAAVYPLFETRSLLVVSTVGYAAFAAAICLLLRRRFASAPSLLATFAVTTVPPLRWWSFKPMTDSFALMLLVAGFGAALLVVDHGARWLPAWFATVLALSFTRDAGVILVLAAVWLACSSHSRRAWLLVPTGVLALLPAPLAFGAPLREALAYTFNRFYPVRGADWNFVADRYWSHLENMLHKDGTFMLRHPEVGFVFASGLACLFLLHLGSDPFIQLMRGSLVASGLYLVLLPQFSAFRLELVLLPAVAVGLAGAAERLLPLLTDPIRKRASVEAP